MPEPAQPLSRIKLVTLLGAVAALVGAVALSSRAHIFGDSAPAVSGSVTRTALDSLLYMFLMLMAVVMVVMAWALWPDDRLQATPLKRRSLFTSMIVPLAVVGLFGLAFGLRMRMYPNGLSIPGLAQRPAIGQPVGGLPGAGLAGGAGGIDWIAAGIVLAICGTTALLAWRKLRRPDRSRAGVAGWRDEVAAEVAGVLDDTLEAIRAESDPRRAVIAAYARMERVLAGHDMPRRPSETPLEFLSRILGSLELSGSSAGRLTDLFEWAKFSTRPVDPAMKEDAIAALEAIRDELRGPSGIAFA